MLISFSHIWSVSPWAECVHATHMQSMHAQIKRWSLKLFIQFTITPLYLSQLNLYNKISIDFISMKKYIFFGHWNLMFHVWEDNVFTRVWLSSFLSQWTFLIFHLVLFGYFNKCISMFYYILHTLHVVFFECFRTYFIMFRQLQMDVSYIM